MPPIYWQKLGVLAEIEKRSINYFASKMLMEKIDEMDIPLVAPKTKPPQKQSKAHRGRSAA